MKTNNTKLKFAIISIVLISLTRFIPHPPNFTAIGAMAIFGGAVLNKDKWLAFIIPFAALFISDLLVNNILYGSFYDSFMWFTEGAAFIYGGFAVMVLLGSTMAKNNKISGVLGSSVLGSLVFFALTNFGAWLGSPIYTNDMAGLMTSYAAGLPFLLNTFAGTLFYSAALFGAKAYASKRAPELAEA